MLPDFNRDGVLPPGVHWAAWPEIESRFGFIARRRHLLSGLRSALEALHIAGCGTVYLDGSFVTPKPTPAITMPARTSQA